MRQAAVADGEVRGGLRRHGVVVGGAAVDADADADAADAAPVAALPALALLLLVSVQTTHF